jgi:hypothetical protein
MDLPMKSVLLLSFELKPGRQSEVCRILELADHYRVHAMWQVSDQEASDDPTVDAILGTPGQEICSGSNREASGEAYVVRRAGWSVLEFFQLQRILAKFHRSARTGSVCRLRIDLRELEPGTCLDSLKQIFAHFAWLRDHGRMVSLTPAELESRNRQAAAASSLTISPTNDFASPNSISVRSM